MFWSTGNHWGLQEDTHYCPNVTCWCVNCQHICMQKLYQFPVCFIYEESLQIDMSTGPNAVDVSTVSSFVCRRSTFVLLPVWQEDTHYCPNPTCWCVNCQLICMQKMHLWNVGTLLQMWREHTDHGCLRPKFTTLPVPVQVPVVVVVPVQVDKTKPAVLLYQYK